MHDTSAPHASRLWHVPASDPSPQKEIVAVKWRAAAVEAVVVAQTTDAAPVVQAASTPIAPVVARCGRAASKCLQLAPIVSGASAGSAGSAGTMETGQVAQTAPVPDAMSSHPLAIYLSAARVLAIAAVVAAVAVEAAVAVASAVASANAVALVLA